MNGRGTRGTRIHYRSKVWDRSTATDSLSARVSLVEISIACSSTVPPSFLLRARATSSVIRVARWIISVQPPPRIQRVHVRSTREQSGRGRAIALPEPCYAQPLFLLLPNSVKFGSSASDRNSSFLAKTRGTRAREFPTWAKPERCFRREHASRVGFSGF